MSERLVLPGDELRASTLFEATGKKPLRLGPGLKLELPDTLAVQLAGPLRTDAKKKLAWIDRNGGRVRFQTRIL
jgi:hypothetical protein